MVSACSEDSEKKLALGYTEDENASRDKDSVAYEERLETWKPAVEVGLVKHNQDVSDSDGVKEWYSVEFSTQGEILHSKGDSKDDSAYYEVYLYERENGLRLMMRTVFVKGEYTVLLQRDSMMAIAEERMDFVYDGELKEAHCRADSTRFVSDCDKENGDFVDQLELEVCSKLHLVCVSSFEPEVDASEYLGNLSGELQKMGDSLLALSLDSMNLADILDSMHFRDERDGQIYGKVKIGNQVWMAENLRYAYVQPTAEWDSSSFCYEGDPAYCEKYGRLYIWSAVMDSAALFSDDGEGCGFDLYCDPGRNVRGVCPEGWRVPNRDEWETLVETVGGAEGAGKMLLSKDYGFEDPYGFDLLAAGEHNEFGASNTKYTWLDDYLANYWTTSESAAAQGYASSFFVDDTGDAVTTSWVKYEAYPVRCIQGTPDSLAAGAVSPSSVVAGTFTDVRDGKVYKSVKIGKQTWMAENLNYEGAEGSTCYDEKEENCALYGRLYTWLAASGLAEDECGYGHECDLPETLQGVCPDGWRLPSSLEIETLWKSVGSRERELKSSDGWESVLYSGNNLYGFDMRPGGYGEFGGNGITYEGAFESGYIWLSETADSNEARVYKTESPGTTSSKIIGMDKRSMVSVRCLKD